MTGFRYGGARYGGARWSARESYQWALDSLPVLPDDVEITPLTVTLSGRIPRSRLSAYREQLASRVGDYRERQQYGGTVKLEPNDGGEPITVNPPSVWQPPAEPFGAVVDSATATEDLGPEHRRAEITLRRTSVPLPDGEVEESGGSLELSFGSWGQVALPADAIGAVSEGGELGGRTLSLPLDLTPLEARAIRAASRTGAIVTRQVTGGDDLVRDTSGGEQTVTITAESTTIVDGDYGVRDYSIERPTHGERPFSASLGLIER